MRIKAMQTLFSVKQGREANYMIGRENLTEKFSRDLNSMEYQDLDQLKANEKDAHALYKKIVLEKNSEARKDFSPEVVQAVNYVLDEMDTQNKRDLSSFKQKMIADVDKLNFYYISFIDLIIQLYQVAEIDQKSNNHNFVNNILIKQLLGNDSVQSALVEAKSAWNKDDNVRGWFRDIIRNNKKYQEYTGLEKAGFEDHKNWILYLVKNILFDNEVLEAYHEENDIFWSENKPIVKSLLVKTFKAMEEEDEEFEFQSVSYNFEDDKAFFIRLFDETVDLDDNFKNLISKKAVNWDIDRLAVTDKIILEMALSEMLSFPSIPIKVTINEYIEVSKLYSTPKSKQFINGMLDVLADELKNNGDIKKSGRGLLDNK